MRRNRIIIVGLRASASMIVARIKTTGARKTAIGAGFRLIAIYIFGGNRPNQKVAMTAPVLQRRDGTDAGGSWIDQFVMPRERTLATLPKPDDSRVTLGIREFPAGSKTLLARL